MFVAIYIKAPMCYATSGESKGQVFRKLVQMGLNPDDFIIKKAKKEKIMKQNKPLTAIVEKHVWVASDGTEFATQEAAQEYEDIMTNPYYKTLKDKVEQLERTIEHLKHDLEMARARNDFLRPQPYFGDVKVN